ncbi:hypothetical protein ACIOJE_09080 [Kitasatospora sp. NPDC087861]|uniref:hypothetical protein n=1 Tax=Kitasatospora sp. NPDC087861 TaxID=3364070 RepID=UPI00382C6794
MTVRPATPGTTPLAGSSAERASEQARAPVIRSEIVIVDDEGNKEPYDPTRH